MTTQLATAQATLFDNCDALPPGLAFRADFITPAEEAALLHSFAALPLRQAQWKGYIARRRVFAWSDRASGDPAEQRLRADGVAPRPTLAELTPELHALRERLARWSGVAPAAFMQVMVAEYTRGAPLGWHRDAPHHELIAGVSLGRPARLRFRPWTESTSPRSSPAGIFTLDLAPRSAYVMRGPARWGWQHSLVAVEGLRYSVTMRTARG